LALGRRDPKGVMAQLGKMSEVSWDVNKALDLMTDKDLEQLRQTQPIRELTKFLEQVRNGAALANA
jgi:hypothetical protein